MNRLWPVVFVIAFVAVMVIGIIAQKNTCSTCPIIGFFTGENKDINKCSSLEQTEPLSNKCDPNSRRDFNDSVTPDFMPEDPNSRNP